MEFIAGCLFSSVIYLGLHIFDQKRKEEVPDEWIMFADWERKVEAFEYAKTHNIAVVDFTRVSSR